MSSGAFDYQTAARRACRTLADRLPAVTYPSGHTDTLEVAARRALLTGVNQTCAKLQDARMDEMGCEFVEVTAHGGARPEHAVWQGKVYHRGGAIELDGVLYEDFETATGYGTGAGLCGWGCRHNFSPFWPGVDTPLYTQQQLDQLNARDIEYNGAMYTRYEITQMQRAKERAVRRYKKRFLTEQTAGLDTGETSVRLKAARQDLKQFVADTDGHDPADRVMVPGFGRSEAAKATAAAKALEKAQERAILVEKIRTAGNLPKAAKLHLEPTQIDIDALTFDYAHINKERAHHISAEQAKGFIKNASISVTVWNGRFERYYGKDGASYVNLETQRIRTSFSAQEFDGHTQAIIKELEQNGLLRER